MLLGARALGLWGSRFASPVDSGEEKKERTVVSASALSETSFEFWLLSSPSLAAWPGPASIPATATRRSGGPVSALPCPELHVSPLRSPCLPAGPDTSDFGT